MKTISIKTLEIKNFKGIKNLKIDFDNKNKAIYGKNETGKTTIKDSFHWLLFNKNSLGKADFQIKPTKKDGSEIHNIETMVQAEILFTEKEILLKKVFSEKWTKKRGSALKEFTGHNIEYFVDNVPVKKRKFDTKISDLIDSDIFKMITDPYEFNNLHWEKRRELLLKICGNIDDEKIINSNKELAGLLFILSDKSIEDHKKVVESKKRDINKQIQRIPIRIDEVNNSINELSKYIEMDDVDKDPIQKNLDTAKEELSKIRNNEKISELQVKINQIDSKIIERQNESSKNWTPPEIINYDFRIKEKEYEISRIENNIVNKNLDASEIESKLEALRLDFDTLNESKPKFEDICSQCGQTLPSDQIDKIIADSNQRKSEKLEKMNEQGKKMVSSLSEMDKDIEKLRSEKENNIKKISVLKVKKEQQEKTLKNTPQKPKADISDLESEKDSIKNEIQKIRDNHSKKVKELEEVISSFESDLNQLRDIELKKESHSNYLKRISELEKEERELSTAYELLENELYLIEKFIVKKVEAIELNVNNKFKMARFKMFKEQINGGIEPCCETIYNGIEFNKDLNSAAKINVGLDIIKTISNHYGFKAPIFIDNAESVNKLIKIDTQVITLHVSLDKELVVIEEEQ